MRNTQGDIIIRYVNHVRKPNIQSRYSLSSTAEKIKFKIPTRGKNLAIPRLAAPL